jgi:hypothetical protein
MDHMAGKIILATGIGFALPGHLDLFLGYPYDMAAGFLQSE